MSQANTVGVEVPSDVRAFAAEVEVEPYLPAVFELARAFFPDADFRIALEADPEIPGDRRITVFASGLRMTPEQAVEATEQWDRGLLTACPPPLAWAFRLAVRFGR